MTLDRALAAMPIVAILRGLHPDDAVAMGEALVGAGLVILEVPLNSPEPFESIGRLAEALKGRALVGAGTVLTEADVDKVAAAGGQLIVSPNTDGAVIARTKRNGMISMPGFFTPSEAFLALAAGADVLKLFPAELSGPAAIRALKAVLPNGAKVMAVGGVTPETIASYLAVGTDGFGIGSDLFKPGRGIEEVARRGQALVAAVNAARSGR